MWTIGGADRLRFPRFPSKLEKRGNARLRPHTHRPRQQGELIIDDSKNHTRPAERTNGVHVKSVDTKSPIQACPPYLRSKTRLQSCEYRIAFQPATGAVFHRRHHPDRITLGTVDGRSTEARCQRLPSFWHPGHSAMSKWISRLLFDQGITSVSRDNSIPSQKKNARTIDASSAPSKPHSSFVGSRFCCQAEAPPLESAGKSGMTIFPVGPSAKVPHVRAQLWSFR